MCSCHPSKAGKSWKEEESLGGWSPGKGQGVLGDFQKGLGRRLVRDIEGGSGETGRDGSSQRDREKGRGV